MVVGGWWGGNAGVGGERNKRGNVSTVKLRACGLAAFVGE